MAQCFSLALLKAWLYTAKQLQPNHQVYMKFMWSSWKVMNLIRLIVQLIYKEISSCSVASASKGCNQFFWSLHTTLATLFHICSYFPKFLQSHTWVFTDCFYLKICSLWYKNPEFLGVYGKNEVGKNRANCMRELTLWWFLPTYIGGWGVIAIRLPPQNLHYQTHFNCKVHRKPRTF